MKKYNSLLFLMLISLPFADSYSQTQKVTYRDYSECYKISNDSVSVIIAAQAGGRVLSYSLNGKNIFYENTSLNGKTLANYIASPFDPDGGRFDVGFESLTAPIHDTTFIGPYTTEITGNYSIKMTSMVDKQLGIDICREFSLDSTSSYLLVRQTMTNRSGHETGWFFWGRTLCPIDGKMIVAVNPESKYKFGWGKYYKSPWRFVHDNPEDTLIQVSDTLLSFRATKTGKSGKYATDADKGWMLYGLNEVLFLKKFDIDLSKVYKTDSAQTIIFYTDGNKFVELEPNSPQALLKPGESYSFDEHWWLFSYPKAKTKNFDGTEAAVFALNHAIIPDTIAEIPDNVNDPDSGKMVNCKLFPNPVDTYITIADMNVSKAELYNLSGKKLFVKVNESAGNIFRFSIEMVPDGLYFLKVYNVKGDNCSTNKLIIHHN